MTQHLNTEQIEALFAFVQKKRVRHYDLQVELVDHLASSIEGLWKENPDVSFEKALQKVYKRFGVTGFSRVIQEKEKALTKFALRWTLAYLKTWLKIPHLLFLVLIIISLAKILLWVPGFAIIWLIVLVVIAVFLGIWDIYLKKELKKKSKKQFMILEARSIYGMLGSGISSMLICEIFSALIGTATPQLSLKILLSGEFYGIWAFALSAYIVLCFLLIYTHFHYRENVWNYINSHFSNQSLKTKI